MVDFEVFPTPGQADFCSNTYAVGEKMLKKCGMKEILKNFLWKIFWACWDRVVAQISIFQKNPKIM